MILCSALWVVLEKMMDEVPRVQHYVTINPQHFRDRSCHCAPFCTALADSELLSQ